MVSSHLFIASTVLSASLLRGRKNGLGPCTPQMCTLDPSLRSAKATFTSMPYLELVEVGLKVLIASSGS